MTPKRREAPRVFSNAGGNTYADLGCRGSINATGIQLYYQAYPGDPYSVDS